MKSLRIRKFKVCNAHDITDTQGNTIATIWSYNKTPAEVLRVTKLFAKAEVTKDRLTKAKKTIKALKFNLAQNKGLNHAL